MLLSVLPDAMLTLPACDAGVLAISSLRDGRKHRVIEVLDAGDLEGAVQQGCTAFSDDREKGSRT
jgi:hypothetical protein